MFARGLHQNLVCIGYVPIEQLKGFLLIVIYFITFDVRPRIPSHWILIISYLPIIMLQDYFSFKVRTCLEAWLVQKDGQMVG